jgi:hypothetical protein
MLLNDDVVLLWLLLVISLVEYIESLIEALNALLDLLHGTTALHLFLLLDECLEIEVGFQLTQVVINDRAQSFEVFPFLRRVASSHVQDCLLGVF